MKIRLEDGLPFVTVKLGRGAEDLVLDRVLLDTGSAATVFAVDEIALGDIQVRDFPIQIGAMKYGFPLQGLLGTDFFVQARVVLDLGLFEVYPSSASSFR